MPDFFVRLVIALVVATYLMLFLPSFLITRTGGCYSFWKKIFTEKVVNAEDLKDFWKNNVDFGEIWDYWENSEKGFILEGFILEIPEGIITTNGEKVAVICGEEKIKVYKLSLPENCNLYKKGQWIKNQPKPAFVPLTDNPYLLFCINKRQ